MISRSLIGVTLAGFSGNIQSIRDLYEKKYSDQEFSKMDEFVLTACMELRSPFILCMRFVRNISNNFNMRKKVETMKENKRK